jgi:hypothetical protein
MDMTTFWSKIPATDKLTTDQVKENQAAWASAQRFLVEDDLDTTGLEWAKTVFPNIGPGGPTSDEDEADLDVRDPTGDEIMNADGPSLGGVVALMAYLPKIDELFIWNDADGWILWNY